ncbi:hypothetical protein [Mumia sp. DW29H23]|uniref:hypothetical protein n=1 Tax=Mumia sp. DW29H23 TaxID=3421241 RepID=UPI003D68E623
MPLFAPYPATPDEILASAAELETRSAAVVEVSADAVRRTYEAGAHLEGTLLTQIPILVGPLRALGHEVDERATFAATVVRAWAVAVTIYDAGVEGLNEEYEAAPVEERAATSAHLRRRHGTLEAFLDDTARRLADLLDGGPSDDAWRGLGGFGPVPSRFTPPPVAAGGRGDPAAITALTILLGDPRACLPETGGVPECLIEAASVLPIGKLLKLRRVLKALEKLDDATDAAKVIDDYVDDATKVFDDLPGGRRPHVRVVDDVASLRDLYGRLTARGEVTEIPRYDGIAVRRPDGVVIGLRDDSKSGGASIDIIAGDGIKRKVHIR